MVHLLFSGFAETAGAASWNQISRPVRWASPFRLLLVLCQSFEAAGQTTRPIAPNSSTDRSSALLIQ